MRVEIEERVECWVLRVIKLYQHLQKLRDGAGLIIGKQLLRSATSIGANLIEARAGESRKDFIHKCSIAQKESRESKYWIRLLLKSEIVPAEKLAGLNDEIRQIDAIVTRIIVNTKTRRT